jgi:predicted RNase H-like HicB family nuclease
MARKSPLVTVKTVGAAKSESEASVVTVEVTVRIKALAVPEEEGGYSVLIPALGIATQGETIAEVQHNAVECIEGWLDVEHDARKDETLLDARGE